MEFAYNNNYQASIQMHPMRPYMGGHAYPESEFALEAPLYGSEYIEELRQ